LEFTCVLNRNEKKVEGGKGPRGEPLPRYRRFWRIMGEQGVEGRGKKNT